MTDQNLQGEEERRQHARIAELEDVADMAIKRIAEQEAQLAAIGAGGVEPLRKRASHGVHTDVAIPISPSDAGFPASGSAAPVAHADSRDVERWIGIGKAIERACADLPEETEIIVSLEKDAGTVTLIDQDGNEHENFSCDYGFAGVLNEAIDAALAAQAKQGGAANG